MTKIVMAMMIHSTMVLKSWIASFTGPAPGWSPMPQGIGAPREEVVSPTTPPELRLSCAHAVAAPKRAGTARQAASAGRDALPNHRPITLVTPCLPARRARRVAARSLSRRPFRPLARPDHRRAAQC